MLLNVTHNIKEVNDVHTKSIWRIKNYQTLNFKISWQKHTQAFDHHSPISPLLEDSVKEGVPSVQVGVEPSTEVGGVHASPLPEYPPLLEWPAPELPDSTLSVDLFSDRDSNLISVILEKTKMINLKNLCILLLFITSICFEFSIVENNKGV